VGGKTAVVTGAAGFMGSQLVISLLENSWTVIGVDNLSTGSMKNLSPAFEQTNFAFHQIDLRNAIPPELFEGVDVVFHLAADPEVRTGLTNPESQFENNVIATYHVLEAMRKTETKRIFFASSSTVYGEPRLLPTPETYQPLSPISIYGSAKLACENLLMGYERTFGLRCVILRPANVVGKNATHGVILDFIAKLRKNESTLEILGDGRQSKSYVGVEDVSEAIVALEKHSRKQAGVEVFNVGNHDKTSVTRIAEILCEEMGVAPTFRFTGGVEGGRAWKGDVRTVLLSIEKLSSIGWRPRISSDETVRLACKRLLRAS
jgi:UDP-glucose 4-epimerase